MKILGKVSTIFSLWLWFILQKWLLMKMSIDLLQEQSNSSTLWPVISITKFSLINIVVKRSYKICRKMMQLIHSTLLLEICASNLQHESSYLRTFSQDDWYINIKNWIYFPVTSLEMSNSRHLERFQVHFEIAFAFDNMKTLKTEIRIKTLHKEKS